MSKYYQHPHRYTNIGTQIRSVVSCVIKLWLLNISFVLAYSQGRWHHIKLKAFLSS